MLFYYAIANQMRVKKIISDDPNANKEWRIKKVTKNVLDAACVIKSTLQNAIFVAGSLMT